MFKDVGTEGTKYDVGELINICLEPVEQVNRFISNRWLMIHLERSIQHFVMQEEETLQRRLYNRHSFFYVFR